MIIDDEELIVEFSSRIFDGIEASGIVPVTLSLKGGVSASNISVVVIPSDQSPVSAEGNGVDYTSDSITAVFIAGTNSTSINVLVTRDGIAEGESETFDLRFMIPSTVKAVIPGNISRATGRIIDIERITVSFIQRTYIFNENNGLVQFVLDLSIPSSTVINVSVNDISDTATAGGIDYNSGPYNVTFSPGVTRVPFDIMINSDNILERNESFRLTIAMDSLPKKVTNVSIAQATVIIVDDDTATINFSQSQYNIVEGNIPLRPSLALSNPSSYNITVQVSSINGTANGDADHSDYTPGPYNVIIPVGITSVPFDVPITDDDILENNETFGLIIRSSSAPDKVIIGSPDQSTVTIVDSDTLMVQFSSRSYTDSESSGNISVTLLLEGGTSSSDITVIVMPSDQSTLSAEGGKDYISNPVNATFLAGTNTATINVSITEDNITEEIETFNLDITLPSSVDNRISIGGITTAVGRIIDKSILIVKFESSQFIGSESSESVQVVIRKSNALSNTIIIVQITLSEHPSMPATGSAVDFDSRPINVNIAPRDTTTMVNIPVMCDRLIEGTEMFDINLSLMSVSHNVTVQLGLNKSIGVIEDSTVHARFEQSTYSIREDLVSLSPVIVLSQPSLEILRLPINLMDISTTEAADYYQQSIIITIPPETMTQQFTINITNDNIVECNETFSLSISTDETWCGLNNNNSSTQVTIIDDDVGVMNIIQPPLLVNESVGSLVIGLSLNITASEDITILTTVASVTASVGSDFNLTSSVIIASGSLSGSVNISILNDTVQEYNETFNVTLQLKPNFSCHLPITLNGEDSFTITIIDDEELTVEFNQATYSGREYSERILVTLNLLGGTAMNDFSVNISTSPIFATGAVNYDNATGGVDYNNATLTAIFTAGTTVATVNIPITDDTVVDEQPEAFNLTFYLIPTTGVRVDPGTRSTATGMIIDTTPPQIYVHPMDKTISINNDSTSIAFTCMAYGSRTYLWERENGINIPSNAEGINSNQLILHNILPPLSGLYRCSAMNDHGTSYSRYAMLTVEALPPVVSVMSVRETELKEGESAEFNCTATGVGVSNFTYQWFLNNQPVDGEDTQNLIVSSVSEGNTGDYTCSVLNPYGVIGRSNNTITLILERFCNPATVSYTGFNIMWNETQVGVTVAAPCAGPGLNGNVSRRCIIDDEWDETVNCFREKTGILRDKAANLSELNDTEKIAEAGNIADSLANVTSSAEEPIFAADVDLAVGILSTLNNVTESIVANLTADDPLLEGTASVIDNLLSKANQENWEQLEMTSPATSQNLVASAEQVTRLLSATLTNNTTEAIKAKPNIVLKAERVSNESLNKGYVFPDEDDNLTAYTGGSAQVMVPGGLLQNISANSQELTISSTVIRDGTGFRLPSSNNGSAEPQVPASPIFSLQIDPLPDPVILKNNPIMMMFDVAISPVDASLEESPAEDLQNPGVQNLGAQNQNFELKDVSCNFYDYSLITDNLNQVGGWSTVGVNATHSNKTSVTCLTTHLTSFAVLVSIQDERPPSPADKALSIISYIGCSVSLMCLCLSIIFLSYTIYRSRDKINHLFIHLNLCIALALGLIVFIAGIENATNNEHACKFVAALLQYFFTSAFCWMLCEGVMLYMMLVTVFGNKLNSRRFFFLLGWGPAIPIVAISSGIVHRHYGTDHYCWIKSDDGAIAAFIVPIVAMMLINCVFLGITLKVLWTNQRKTMSEKVSANADLAKDLLKAIIVLLPLLGLTWIIGILAVNNETQVFAWIFAILNSLQGVFIFIFHVLRNKQVGKELRDRYNYVRGSTVFRRMFTSRGSGSTSTFGISTKARTSQSSSSEVSGRGKKISTTSFGSGGGEYLSTTLERRISKDEYLSTTLERRLSKDKSEAFDDSVFEDEKQIKMTTFRKVEESIIEEHDIGVEEKQPVKDNREADEEDKKSITEEDVEQEKKLINEEAVEEEKKPITEVVEKEKSSSTKEEGTTVAVDAAATTKPTPLPRTIK